MKVCKLTEHCRYAVRVTLRLISPSPTSSLKDFRNNAPIEIIGDCQDSLILGLRQESSHFSLISLSRFATSIPVFVSLFILLGVIIWLSIKPSACKALIVSLHHCSVIPTHLAMSLFCNGPFSSRIIRIFCLTVRNMLIHDKFAYL